ncbi:MAG: ankyrin repeat domain-containing protein [Ginsengibacter sp.]
MNNLNEILDAIKICDNDKLNQIITDKPSIADIKTEQGISLLQFAAYCRNKSGIELLRNYRKELDIFEAASIADIDAVTKLINQNPDLINSFSADGFTPLGLASFFGNTDIVKLLLSNGANPGIAANNQFKVAPLHSACATSNYDIAELLIKNGADVNARQMQGVSPLHSAAHNGKADLAKLLIDCGADVNAKTDNGQTPLFMAEEKGFTETAELIKQYGGQ